MPGNENLEKNAQQAVNAIEKNELPTNDNNLKQLDTIASYWKADHANSEAKHQKLEKYIKENRSSIDKVQNVNLSSAPLNNTTVKTALICSSEIMKKMGEMYKDAADTSSQLTSNYDKKYTEWNGKWKSIFEKHKYPKNDFTACPYSNSDLKKSTSRGWGDEDDLNGNTVKEARQEINDKLIPNTLSAVGIAVPGIDIKSLHKESKNSTGSGVDFFGKLSKKGIEQISKNEFDQNLGGSLKEVSKQKVGLFREDKDIIKNVQYRAQKIASLVDVAKAVEEKYKKDKKIAENAGFFKPNSPKKQGQIAPSDNETPEQAPQELDKAFNKNLSESEDKANTSDLSSSDDRSDYGDYDDSEKEEKLVIKNIAPTANKDLYIEEKYPTIFGEAVPHIFYNASMKVIWEIKDMCIYYLKMITAFVDAKLIKLDNEGNINNPYILAMVKYCIILLQRANATEKEASVPTPPSSKNSENEGGDQNINADGEVEKDFNENKSKEVEENFEDSNKGSVDLDFENQPTGGGSGDVEVDFDDLPDDIDSLTDPWGMIRAGLITTSCVVLKNFAHMEDLKDKNSNLFSKINNVLCNLILSGNEIVQKTASNTNPRQAAISNLFMSLKEYVSEVQKNIQENREPNFIEESSKKELLEKINRINDLLSNETYFLNPTNGCMRKIFEIMEETGEEDPKGTFLGEPYINNKGNVAYIPSFPKKAEIK